MDIRKFEVEFRYETSTGFGNKKDTVEIPAKNLQSFGGTTDLIKKALLPFVVANNPKYNVTAITQMREIK